MDEQPTLQPQDDNQDDKQDEAPSQEVRQVADVLAEQAIENKPTPVGETEPVQAPEAPKAEEAPTEAETPAQAEPAEEEAEEAQPLPQVPALSPIDPKQFTDENGYVDVNAMTAAFNQRMAEAVSAAGQSATANYQAERAEERSWEKAIEQYPELKTDRSLRDLVQNARIGKVTDSYQRAGNNPEALKQVKIPTPSEMAKVLFDRLGKVKQEAVTAATEQTKIAQSAYVESASTPQKTASKSEQLFQKISDPRDPIGAREAQTELLKSLLFPEQ